MEWQDAVPGNHSKERTGTPTMEVPDWEVACMPSPLPTKKTVTKTGYVSEFTITAQTSPKEGAELEFFSVTVTDNPEGSVNPSTFHMDRGPTPPADTQPSGALLEVTYGSAQIAALAALKDAYLHGKRVIVSGFGYVIGQSHEPPKRVTLESVTLSERSGPYLGIPQQANDSIRALDT
jgi:hypothetical protein